MEHTQRPAPGPRIETVEVEVTVEMIELMLQTPCQQVGAVDLDRSPREVHAGHHDPQPTSWPVPIS